MADPICRARTEILGTPDDLYTVNDLHLPVNEEVVIAIKSKDVLHSFFLPNVRVKQDVVPGMKQYVWFKPVKEGTYDIVCAELCGWGHYKMKGRMTVESRPQYRTLAETTAGRIRIWPNLRQTRSRAFMSSVTVDGHGHAGHSPRGRRCWRVYLDLRVFSRPQDHRAAVSVLDAAVVSVGGLLALGIRWQLAWPWSRHAGHRQMLFSGEGGQISPEFYTMLFTMHATVMIFFVIIPILAGAFGNYLIPLMIGADDMAFPTLNMLSYWFMWPAFICIGMSFFAPATERRLAGRPIRRSRRSSEAAPGSGPAQTLWLLGMTFVGVSSMMGSVNYMTTIIQMRAPGMTMFRLPLTIWGMFITAILQAFALPVLTAAGFMQLIDRMLGTGFFIPEGSGRQQLDAAPVAAASRCCGSTCSGSTRTRPFTS